MASNDNQSIKVSVIQFNAGINKTDNLIKIEALLNQALKTNPDLICLPEVFNLRTGNNESVGQAEKIPEGESTLLLTNFAKKIKYGFPMVVSLKKSIKDCLSILQ